MTQPLAIDLYCGLGGWAEGLLSEGYRVIGFDIERHDYQRAPGRPATSTQALRESLTRKAAKSEQNFD